MKKSIRGINFAEKFKESVLYKDLYLKHRDELFLGIRNDYLNIYYNNISIAKVSYTQGGMLKCEMNEYYLTGVSNSPTVTMYSDAEVNATIIEHYDTIKKYSDQKSNEEKKSQSALFIRNNRNKDSEWYCTDVEWCRPRDNEHLDFNARFDIVAISKKAPYRIAIIELKYGRDSIGGESGINKHISDFDKFNRYGYFDTFKLECKSILRNLSVLDPDYPEDLQLVRSDQMATSPEYYVITLDNNSYGNQCTPKQTIGGYLFNDSSRWNSIKVSKNTVESKFGDVTNPDNPKVFARFLFSPTTLDELRELSVIDIIEDKIYQQPSRQMDSSSEARITVLGSTSRVAGYRTKEKLRQLELLNNESSVFYGAHGGGTFSNRSWEFCIKDEESHKNLYKDIVTDCLEYFKKEHIVFWGSEGIPNHILSSQIACLNHLFAIRQDKELVLQLGKMFVGEDVVDVERMNCDKSLTYISFEVTSRVDHLNERFVKRGANCTSVDAAIMVIMKDGKKTLVPIEWKYTEGKEYNIDKSGTEGSGKERLRRYSDLINNSNQLLPNPQGYLNTLYFVEPFYQLMRQTLWAEQIIENKETELLKADDFVHIHVIPEENEQLLHRNYRYSGKGLEETWRAQIIHQQKYKWVKPIDIVRLISKSNNYTAIIEYLKTRYGYKDL